MYVVEYYLEQNCQQEENLQCVVELHIFFVDLVMDVESIID